MFFLRLTFSGPDVGTHQIFLDTDGDRSTGMWTYQSPVSAAGWDLLVDTDGGIYRHTGPPTVWRFEPTGVNAERRGVGNTIDICIPTTVLDGAPRVRVAALSGDTWLPDPFLADAAYPAVDDAALPAPTRPTRLAIHYGAEPWFVRDCTDIVCAADAYAPFAHVVLGAGLEDPGHPTSGQARAFIAELRRRSPRTEVWGYISLVGTNRRRDGRYSALWDEPDLDRLVGRWKQTGATGIFVDEANLCRPDWGQTCPQDTDGRILSVTRARQARVTAAAHEAGLAVFANAFSPFDALAPADGRPTPLGGGARGRPADMYLLENPTVAAGESPSGLDASAAQARLRYARTLADEAGVRLAAVDTTSGPVGDDSSPDAYLRGWRAASQAGCHTYGFTNGSYSASEATARNLAVLAAPTEA
jgi:hypothetical protein